MQRGFKQLLQASLSLPKAIVRIAGLPLSLTSEIPKSQDGLPKRNCLRHLDGIQADLHFPAHLQTDTMARGRHMGGAALEKPPGLPRSDSRDVSIMPV